MSSSDRLGSHCIHIDTTNFSVTGAYEPDLDVGEIAITYGHPKDGRWDLKRFVLGMAANQYGVTLSLQTFSGNESDKETILTIIQHLNENLRSDEKVYHVADSAFYTAPNLQTLGQHPFWISRVPSRPRSRKSGTWSGQRTCSCPAPTTATPTRSTAVSMRDPAEMGSVPASSDV